MASKGALSRIPTCPLCSKRFRLTMQRQQPRLLLCGHSICDGCLETTVYATSSPRCPCCVPPTPLPADRTTIPINDVLARHAERCIAAATGDGGAKPLCDGCRADGLDAVPAVARCDTCDKSVCADHSKIHERRGHKVKQDEAVAPVSNECDKHPRSPLFFYCFTCSAPVCQSCTVLEHPPASHDVKDSRIAAETLAKRLENGVKVFTKATSDLEGRAAAAMAAMDNEARVRDDSIRAITTALEIIVSAAQAKLDAMKFEVVSTHDAHVKALQGQLAVIKQQFTQLTYMCEVGAAAAAGKDPVDIAKTMSVMSTVAHLIQPDPGLPYDPASTFVPKFELSGMLAAIDALPSGESRVARSRGVSPATVPPTPDISHPAPAPAPAPIVSSSSPPPVGLAPAPVVTTAPAAPPEPPTPASAAASGTSTPSATASVPDKDNDATPGNLRPRVASTGSGSNVHHLQSQLAAKFATGGAAPFGSVPVMIRQRSPASEVEGERKSDVAPKSPAPVPQQPRAVDPAAAGLTLLQPSPLKALYKLSLDGQTWEARASANVSCVLIGKGASFKILFYDAAQRHICVAALTPEVDCNLQRGDSAQFRFRVATPGVAAGVDGNPGAWCAVFPDPDTAATFLRAFMITQFHCVWHSFGVEGVSKMRLKCPLNSPPSDARVLAEGDTAGVIVSMWALYGGPSDHPMTAVSVDPLFTNTVTKKLVRCLVVKGVGAGLNEALCGMQVGSRFIVFLPSVRALEVVGLADCGDEGAWVACDVRVEKYKAKEEGAGGVPRHTAGISDLLDVD